jgi:hypothetical protein
MVDQRAFDVLPLLGSELAVGVSQLEKQGAGRKLHPRGRGRGGCLGRHTRSPSESLVHEPADGFQHSLS